MKKLSFPTSLAFIASLLLSCSSDVEPPSPPPEPSSSSSIQVWQSSSSSNKNEYGYCVFITERLCLTGPFTDCPTGGTLSNSCPYGSSSSEVSSLPSSSSAKSSSSSVASSSSGSRVSSSSLVQISSSSIQSGVVYGTPVTYQGETYETVVIGSQTWMSKNLNYATSVSKCYNNQESNCTTYGRLYDWATAMALPTSCNTSSCTSQIGSKHRGICPIGWHIPSSAEWGALMQFVNPSCSLTGNCPNAGKQLKATNGWSSYNNGTSGNGEDVYGFSALPGGLMSDGGSGSYNAGRYGLWWSASENDANYAYGRDMYSSYDAVYYYEDVCADCSFKVVLRSIRCLKD